MYFLPHYCLNVNTENVNNIPILYENANQDFIQLLSHLPLSEELSFGTFSGEFIKYPGDFQ